MFKEKKKPVPTAEDFDRNLLKSQRLYSILNQRIALVDERSDPGKYYYRTYENGRGIGSVIHADGLPSFNGDYVDAHNHLPELDVEFIKALAAGKQMIDANSLDPVLRQFLTLEQIVSDKLSVIITFDSQPGHSRVYPVTSSGRFTLNQNIFVKTLNEQAISGVWVYAMQVTNKPDFHVVDLRGKA